MRRGLPCGPGPPVLRSRAVRALFACACLLAALALSAGAAPHTASATIVRGGLVELVPGTRVEGSVSHGGQQPDYLLDTWSPRLAAMLTLARRVGAGPGTRWQKIDHLLGFIANHALPGEDTDRRRFQALLRAYRERGEPVPLSRYLEIGVGDNRENALLTHLMLQAAGITNRHACATVVTGDGEFDHSFCVVSDGGADWVVDSLYEAFNGYRLADLEKPGGPAADDPVAPLTRHFHYRRIMRINEFPRYLLPARSHGYQVQRGGPVRLTPGAVVEGSSVNGGMQPDYLVDSDSPVLKALLGFARAVGHSSLTYWEKVDRLLDFVGNHVLPAGEYDDADYLALMKRYREAGQRVPLSAYARIHAGVCRENALFTHLLLAAAGIDNRHVYAKVDGGDGVQDHAFTVVEHDGASWVVDSYFESFDGYRVSDLMKPGGPAPGDPVAPLARHHHFRRVLRINPYPLYTFP